MPGETLTRFKRWFWRPPRPHGDTILDRSVSFLELFYDLVYVVVISQAAHHLADEVSVRTLAEFVVVFGMIWVGWVNGSIYLEQHGRDDGRTRLVVFVQMALLALLAVFTADATGSTGQQFALVYGAFLALMTWLWYSVRRQDRPELMTLTGIYLAGMIVSLAAITISAFLASDARLVVWAGYWIGWIVVMVVLGWRGQLNQGTTPTESMVERFGLFTIIVLGEVVFGVVNGMSAVVPDVKTIGTGMLALVIGFGLWWIYFDLVGRRLPRPTSGALASWMVGHFPLALAIAAGGAAMVSLIGQAHELATPTSTAVLLSGSVAVGLIALIPIERALVDAERLSSVYRPLGMALGIGALAALSVGLLRPAPWLLALLLVVVLSAVWIFAVNRFLRAGAWGDEPSEP